jgi:hypothetical protein
MTEIFERAVRYLIPYARNPVKMMLSWQKTAWSDSKTNKGL